ncbi:MAG: GNAT family N-acetyltransferase [Acidimicrobiales bacterium]
MRLAALADSPASFGSTYDREFDYSDEEWTERAVRGSTGFDRATFFAVTEDEEVVGLVGGFRGELGSLTVDLVSMWIAPQVRRGGIGQMLVQAVIDWARSIGATDVQLWVTRGNTPAENLYHKIGFLDTGDHQPLPSDPRKDEIRMTAAL